MRRNPNPTIWEGQTDFAQNGCAQKTGVAAKKALKGKRAIAAPEDQEARTIPVERGPAAQQECARRRGSPTARRAEGRRTETSAQIGNARMGIVESTISRLETRVLPPGPRMPVAHISVMETTGAPTREIFSFPA